MSLIKSSRLNVCLILLSTVFAAGSLGCAQQPTATIVSSAVQITPTPDAAATAAAIIATSPTAPEPSTVDATSDHVPGLPLANVDSEESSATQQTASGAVVAFVAAPDRDLFRLASELVLPLGAPGVPRMVNVSPVNYAVGHEETFWLVDFDDTSVYQADFELKKVSPRAYWYVEKGQNVNQADLERSAAEFESNIYPKVTEFFGLEWSPGVDNDPHLNIIHAHLRGVAGYYSSADEHPQAVYEHSNQRETIYVNIRSLRVGSQAYHEVLAHELQHAAHWNADSSEETWINEGLSELAVLVAGYTSNSGKRYLNVPNISLTHWPLDYQNIGAHYGGASLFMSYFSEHYSSQGNLIQFVSETKDGIPGINTYLSDAGYDATFHDVFQDWLVANLLDEEQSLYGYRDLEVSLDVEDSINEFSPFSSVVPQFAPKYIELNRFVGPIRLRFDAPTENTLLPVEVGDSGCWWSNSGDSISSTLTRTLDLRELSAAMLTYQVWFNVEEEWDYGYVEISRNQGLTWDILKTPSSTSKNPIGTGFGPGYSGSTQDWIDETVDLGDYTGQEVLLRLHYVTDDAVNGAGLCFRQIELSGGSGLGILVLDDAEEWQSEGFVLINNRVKQDYSVQVVQKGSSNQILVMALDVNNSGEIIIPSPLESSQIVVIVAAMAPQTLQPAPYTLIMEPADSP